MTRKHILNEIIWNDLWSDYHKLNVPQDQTQHDWHMVEYWLVVEYMAILKTKD